LHNAFDLFILAVLKFLLTQNLSSKEKSPMQENFLLLI